MMKSKTPISDAVKKAVKRSGLSRYEICKRAGIDQAAMSRFMAGKTGLTTTSLDALADVLGLRIVADGPAKVLPADKPGRKPTAKGR